jgi:hypothetical protein
VEPVASHATGGKRCRPGGVGPVRLFPRHDQTMMNDCKELMESALFRPVIDRSYPLAGSCEAYPTSRLIRRSETS